jgi:hypothetical protein
MTDGAARTAAQCRHYAMCKIDYLGTGLCASGRDRHYVAYYPQGRMDIYDALTRGLVDVTEGLVEIAESCTLCGICDTQCHFATGMRPSVVMEALKDRVARHIEAGRAVVRPPKDPILDELRAIVGAEHATNDPGILVAYSNDPFPLKDAVMPRCVVLPGSAEDVASILKLARRRAIPYAVRGNGGSVYGMVFSPGIVLDMNRMKEIEIDPDNWTATIGAGVTAFELQREAARVGLRINAAEPAATVCGNIICSGLFSTWSATYGTFADNFVDMEFVADDGRLFRLSERSAPNLSAYEHAIRNPPGVCTRAAVRLYPVTDDEEGLLVPFAELGRAIQFARELNVRRIGLAVGVLGPHYIATFLSPSEELSVRLETAITDVLGMNYGVFVVVDAHGREAVRKMASSVLDGRILRMIMLGLPRLLDPEWLDLVRGLPGKKRPYEILADPDMEPLLETVLRPSSETIAEAVDEDLRPFYEKLYSRPEYTDIVWLNTFRIVSCRMSRRKHMVAFLIYVPLDRTELVNAICRKLGDLADASGLENSYGFLTPMDLGKRAMLEYDCYIDHTDPVDRERSKALMAAAVPWLDELAMTETGVTWIKTFFSQGCARKEQVLYRGLTPRADAGTDRGGQPRS